MRKQALIDTRELLSLTRTIETILNKSLPATQRITQIKPGLSQLHDKLIDIESYLLTRTLPKDK